MTHTRMWYALGLLFAIGFASSLGTLLLAQGDKGVLATVVALMVGALLLWFLIPRLSEFSVGPKGVAAKVSKMQRELHHQSEQVREQGQLLEQQQMLVNELVKYSMSASIFHHLCGIVLLKRYTYHDSDVNQRELYFLRDSGFIQPKSDRFLDFNASIDRKNLVEIAEPTPIGWFCVRMRKDEIPDIMLQGADNLRVDPDSI